MLKELLSNRFTAKWWSEKTVEEDKLQYVLDCTYLSPSKNPLRKFREAILTWKLERTLSKKRILGHFSGLPFTLALVGSLMNIRICSKYEKLHPENGLINQFSQRKFASCAKLHL